jgi:hypothetical protein
MAGLLDLYSFQGITLALTMVKDEAAYFAKYIDDIIADKGISHWHKMLEVEFGGAPHAHPMHCAALITTKEVYFLLLAMICP